MLPFLRQTIVSFLKKFLENIFPFSCVLCDARAAGQDICVACLASLPWLEKACQRCAIPLSDNFNLCGECIKVEPPFVRTIALWHYQSPIDFLLTELKFHQRLLYARVTGEILAEKIVQYYQGDQLPECIVPVPLGRKRLSERGFNQALEIARPLAKKLAIPIDKMNLRRIRATLAQSALPAAKRQANIRSAFQIRNASAYTGHHVVILDDIITTGSTVTEVAHILQKNGARRIDVWCCARTGKHCQQINNKPKDQIFLNF